MHAKVLLQVFLLLLQHRRFTLCLGQSVGVRGVLTVQLRHVRLLYSSMLLRVVVLGTHLRQLALDSLQLISSSAQLTLSRLGVTAPSLNFCAQL